MLREDSDTPINITYFIELHYIKKNFFIITGIMVKTAINTTQSTPDQ